MRSPVVSESHRPNKFIIFGLRTVATYFIITSISNMIFHSLVMTYTITAEQRHYWIDMDYLIIALIRGAMAMNLMGGILLLQRRKLAFILLAVPAGLNLLTLLINVATKGMSPGMTLGWLIMQYGLLSSAIGFVYYLYRRNILWR